jgi:hypothetical protein
MLQLETNVRQVGAIRVFGGAMYTEYGTDARVVCMVYELKLALLKYKSVKERQAQVLAVYTKR